jgi:hypothetical protein
VFRVEVGQLERLLVQTFGIATRHMEGTGRIMRKAEKAADIGVAEFAVPAARDATAMTAEKLTLKRASSASSSPTRAPATARYATHGSNLAST